MNYKVNGLDANIYADEKDINFVLQEIGNIAQGLLDEGIEAIDVDVRHQWMRKLAETKNGAKQLSKLKMIGRGYWYLPQLSTSEQ